MTEAALRICAKTEVSTLAQHVCCTLKSRRPWDGFVCPLGAISGNRSNLTDAIRLECVMLKKAVATHLEQRARG